MRRFVLSVIACVAFAGSSFASNEVIEKVADSQEPTKNVELLVNNIASEPEKVEFAKNCYIAIYNSRGVYLDTVVITDVPDNVSCGSKSVHDAAIYYFVSNQYIVAP